MKSIELWQQLAEEIVPIPLFWTLRGLDVFFWKIGLKEGPRLLGALQN